MLQFSVPFAQNFLPLFHAPFTCSTVAAAGAGCSSNKSPVAATARQQKTSPSTTSLVITATPHSLPSRLFIKFKTKKMKLPPFLPTPHLHCAMFHYIYFIACPQLRTAHHTTPSPAAAAALFRKVPMVLSRPGSPGKACVPGVPSVKPSDTQTSYVRYSTPSTPFHPTERHIAAKYLKTHKNGTFFLAFFPSFFRSFLFASSVTVSPACLVCCNHGERKPLNQTKPKQALRCRDDE